MWLLEKLPPLRADPTCHRQPDIFSFLSTRGWPAHPTAGSGSTAGDGSAPPEALGGGAVDERRRDRHGSEERDNRRGRGSSEAREGGAAPAARWDGLVAAAGRVAGAVPTGARAGAHSAVLAPHPPDLGSRRRGISRHPWEGQGRGRSSRRPWGLAGGSRGPPPKSSVKVGHHRWPGGAALAPSRVGEVWGAARR